ncbi:MAG: RNA polymerase sporulation sigma factor SigE, partial [Tepidanaerobacteraceae bacterium]|nr:RNA polymerase sporulation sigma factor SigE [Tepidanaerobacteraceae bacterium]
MIKPKKIKIAIIKWLKQLGILKKSVIYYIGGSEALPPPLTGDEELLYLHKLEMGDTAVKTVLIERNLRLVV